MSSLPLWLSIEPARSEVRLLLSEPSAGTALKARLPPQPTDGRALMLLLEALSLWYGLPLHAVLDADAEDVRRHPERWSLLLGDAPERAVRVEWVAVPCCRKHDRCLESMGDFASGRQLVSFAATGQRCGSLSPAARFVAVCPAAKHGPGQLAWLPYALSHPSSPET